MGVIQRQSIKQSLVNYIGVGIAAISTIFIYPQDTETYGLARFIIDTSLMLVPFIMMGFSSVTIRYFPYFKSEEKGHHGFLFFLILILSGGAIVFILFSFLFKDQFYNLYAEKPFIYQQFLPYLAPLAILMAFLQLFYNYSSNFKRIAVLAIFQNLIKISLPFLILFFIWQYLSIEQVINGILVTFILALIGVIVYIYWLGQLKLKPDFSLFNKGKIKEIRGFAFYSFFSNFGNVLAFRIDMFMVPTLLDFKENGIYAIALFIAGAIAIPTNAITQISGPIVAESLKNNDLVHVKQLYQSSSINLLVVGLLLFVCIMVSIEDLFSIMPKNEELTDGLVIVFLIGLAKIIDMATSINNQIINYSKYYRFGFYAILLMAAFNITANLILIPKFQIIGAAVATLLSLSIYNLVKMIFIHWKFKIQPFTWNTLWVLLIAVGAYGIGILIPATEIAILDILLKSVVIGSVYSLLVYYLKISEELNNMLDKFLKRLRE